MVIFMMHKAVYILCATTANTIAVDCCCSGWATEFSFISSSKHIFCTQKMNKCGVLKQLCVTTCSNLRVNHFLLAVCEWIEVNNLLCLSQLPV